MRIGKDPGPAPETVELPGAGGGYTIANSSGGLAGPALGEIRGPKGRHRDLKIDTIEEWPGDPRPVALDLTEVAGTARLTVSVITTGAWIHSRHEHEARRIGDGESSAADLDDLVLQWLALGFEDRPPHLGDLVEEENAMVRE
jgi:hypothetical protein